MNPHRKDGGAAGRMAREREKVRARMKASNPNESARRLRLPVSSQPATKPQRRDKPAA